MREFYLGSGTIPRLPLLLFEGATVIGKDSGSKPNESLAKSKTKSKDFWINCLSPCKMYPGSVKPCHRCRGREEE